jgi:hypothetical protein
MQLAMPHGLESAVGTPNARHHIVPIQNAAAQAETFKGILTDQWATKKPVEAHDFLAMPDVTVTNQSDKEGQLPKIKVLDEKVAETFKAIEEQHDAQLAAAEAAVARAKAQARGNEAVAMVEAAERAAKAVRSEQDIFKQAIDEHMMPMVMMREVPERAERAERYAEWEAEYKAMLEEEIHQGGAFRRAVQGLLLTAGSLLRLRRRQDTVRLCAVTRLGLHPPMWPPHVPVPAPGV